MNADPQLRERLQRAGSFDGLPVEPALSAVHARAAALHRRRKAETFAVVAVIVALLAVVAARALQNQTDQTPGVTPTASPAPTEQAIEVIPPPEGTTTNLTVPEAEQHVLDRIANDESQIGGSLAPARIISVEFIPGHTMAGIPYDTWHIRFEGTFLANCGPEGCAGSRGGQIWFSDKAPNSPGAWETADPRVCVTRQYVGSPNCKGIISGRVPMPTAT